MSTSDRDECAGLVEEIWCSLPESPHIRHRDARAIARSVYNSDWLAAREVEAGARALEEVADALEGRLGTEGTPKTLWEFRQWLRARAADLRGGGEG